MLSHASAEGETTAERDERPLLEATNIIRDFALGRGVLPWTAPRTLRAVDNVSITLTKGQTLGVVGESGSGKSTLARTVSRLIEPTSGSVTFDGDDVLTLGRSGMKTLRRRVQFVFQDPFNSLDPRMTVQSIVGEPLLVHKIVTKDEKTARVVELLEMVGLSSSDLHKYAHQFSGGQAQRIGIARALATSPDLIICDEAVSALDVSTQAQILNLLRDLQADLGFSYLFIAHDLNVVRYMSDHVAVMYLGQVVETAPSEVLFERPEHPYTRALLEAIADPDPRNHRRRGGSEQSAEMPDPVSRQHGCPFKSRCPEAVDSCADERPYLKEVATDHKVACLRREKNTGI